MLLCGLGASHGMQRSQWRSVFSTASVILGRILGDAGCSTGLSARHSLRWWAAGSVCSMGWFGVHGTCVSIGTFHAGLVRCRTQIDAVAQNCCPGIIGFKAHGLYRDCAAIAAADHILAGVPHNTTSINVSGTDVGV